MTLVEKLLTEEVFLECGLFRLEQSEMEALVRVILEMFAERERKRLPRSTVRAIPPDGRSVELEDGVKVALDGGQRALLGQLSLSDPVVIFNRTLDRLDPDERAMLRRMIGEDQPPSSVAESAIASIRFALRTVMEHGAELMKRAAIAGQSFVVQFRFVGPGGGEYYWQVADGEPSAHEGFADNPSLLIEVRAAEFLDIVKHKTVSAQQALRTGGPARFRESKRWVSGARMLTEARQGDRVLPLLFADAVAVSPLICWGEIAEVVLDDSGTEVHVVNLRRIEGSHMPHELTLLRGGRKLSQNDIYPYRLSRTPSFLG